MRVEIARTSKVNVNKKEESIPTQKTIGVKKRQTHPNERMAKRVAPRGVTRSVLTVRDDPLAKAKIFLTEIPDLD